MSLSDQSYVAKACKARAATVATRLVLIGRQFCSSAYRRPLGAIGLGLVIGTVVMAVAAPVISPHDPNTIYADAILSPPSRTFLLGTDQLGRDVLSQTIYGARTSVIISLAGLAIGSTMGFVAGLIGGYYAGLLDTTIQRIVDMVFIFPTIVVGIAIMVMLPSSLLTVCIAVAVPLMPRTARVVRAAVLSTKQQTYLESARAVGCSNSRILFWHVMPNCIAPFLVISTALLGTAILSEAALSFLGMGVQAPHASWGRMLASDAAPYLTAAPWMAVAPGIAMTAFIFGVNVVGDTLGDLMNPRLRSR